MYSVLHVFYRLVLKTLNESQKLWVKNFLLEKRNLRELPGGLVVRTQHSDSQGRVWSLVRELKSHKLDRVAKKKKSWAERKEGRLFYPSCSRTLLCSMQMWSLATLSFILGDWIGTNLELGCCICVCISLVYSLTPCEEKQNPHSLGQLHSSVSPDIYFPFWNIHFHLLIAGFNGKERSSPAFHWALSSQRSLTWDLV